MSLDAGGGGVGCWERRWRHASSIMTARQIKVMGQGNADSAVECSCSIDECGGAGSKECSRAAGHPGCDVGSVNRGCRDGDGGRRTWSRDDLDGRRSTSSVLANGSASSASTLKGVAKGVGGSDSRGASLNDGIGGVSV